MLGLLHNAQCLEKLDYFLIDQGRIICVTDVIMNKLELSFLYYLLGKYLKCFENEFIVGSFLLPRGET